MGRMTSLRTNFAWRDESRNPGLAMLTGLYWIPARVSLGRDDKVRIAPPAPLPVIPGSTRDPGNAIILKQIPASLSSEGTSFHVDANRRKGLGPNLDPGSRFTWPG